MASAGLRCAAARVRRRGRGPGRGLLLFRWICALHDFGKATPMFQARFPESTRRVRDAGLTYHVRASEGNTGYRHERAGPPSA
ncbi:hypothetical protein GTX14_15015 [Streptomyces sp. SID4944]|nr:hypothetical protein [Streptomyces sp. SID4944]